MHRLYRQCVTPDSPTIYYTSPSDPLASPLVTELSREYNERYGLNDGIPSSAELSRYPAEVFEPAAGGAFLLLLEQGEAVAGGAFMRVDEATVEVKRVWTDSRHRRRGLARLVMAELEAEAARRGVTTIELTTGARQPEAVALYLALGYTPLFELAADYELIGYLHFRKRLVAD